MYNSATTILVSKEKNFKLRPFLFSPFIDTQFNRYIGKIDIF